MKRMGALENGLEETELQPTVDSWRRANRAIVGLWYKTDRCARALIETGAPQDIGKGLKLIKQGPLMRLYLPSGRALSYVKPRISPEGYITFEGIFQTGGWGRQETYGAKLVENITQAVARDCLAEAIRRLESRNIPVVFHVHDEVICEVPKEGPGPEEVAEIMGAPIEWAPGLPLKADAYECEYYRKD